MPSEITYQTHDYLIDSLLPAYEVHLIGGPTGAGKTTWLLALLDSWRKGEKIFGYDSHPVPFLYISLDRSRAGMDRTFQRMKLDPSVFNLIVPNKIERSTGLLRLLENAIKNHPNARLVVIEGFQTGVKNKNDNTEVANFLSDIRDFCVARRVTVLGVVQTSKQKQNAKYENPRERVAGAMEWGAFTETLVTVEPKTDASGLDADLRDLQVLPRNAKSIRMVMEFKEGRLVEQAKSLTTEQKLLAYLSSRPFGELHSGDALRSISGLKSDSRFYEVISTLVSLGRLSKVASPDDSRKMLYRFIPPAASGTN